MVLGYIAPASACVSSEGFICSKRERKISGGAAQSFSASKTAADALDLSAAAAAGGAGEGSSADADTDADAGTDADKDIEANFAGLHTH